MRERRYPRGLAWAGIVGPVAFVTSWVVAGSLREGYDPIHDAISRLAELGAANRWIVTTGIAVFGASCVLMAVALRARWSAARSSAALAAAGFLSIAVALFPCTAGCPGEGSFTDVAHSVVAGGHYIALVSAAAALRWDPGGPRSWAAISLALAALAGTALFVHGFGLGANGLFQRLGLSLLDLWMIATAVLLLSGSASGGEARQLDGRAAVHHDR